RGNLWRGRAGAHHGAGGRRDAAWPATCRDCSELRSPNRRGGGGFQIVSKIRESLGTGGDAPYSDPGSAVSGNALSTDRMPLCGRVTRIPPMLKFLAARRSEARGSSGSSRKGTGWAASSFASSSPSFSLFFQPRRTVLAVKGPLRAA